MAKPPPIGSAPPPNPQQVNQPVTEGTKKAPTLEEKALAAALASATKYCEVPTAKSGPAIMRCDAGAGRFAGSATELQGLRWREGNINGLPVSFVPAGYDAVAAGAAKGYMVLELNQKLQPTYGRFVAVKVTDYENKRNTAAFGKLGTPVNIDRALLAEGPSTMTPENYPPHLEGELKKVDFPAYVNNVQVRMENGKLMIRFTVTVTDLDGDQLNAITRQIQAMVRKTSRDWGLPELIAVVESRVVQPSAWDH